MAANRSVSLLDGRPGLPAVIAATRLLLGTLPWVILPAISATADDHAVILIYHHVADDTPASTSVTPTRFAEHLDYLAGHGYVVLPLPEVLDKLAHKESLPENAVVITFDDAYRSVYTTARPMLEIRGWPYTVFVSTDYLDKDYDNYLTWPELRQMAAQGATIGNHGVDHRSALSREAGESRSAWLERVRDNAVAAQERISSETGTVPKIYAWPYGEFNVDVESVMADLGWYAVGQQSGAAGYTSSVTAVPRFPQATGYDDPDNFSLRVQSEPLPIAIDGDAHRWIESGNPPPALSFTLDDARFRIGAVNCYNSRGKPLQITRADGGHFVVRSATPLADGRSKYTCTAPHQGKAGVFGWYSYLWVVGRP